MRKYSFIIPTYQNKQVLENTLTALDYLKTDGSFTFEAIVADDGSTDGTLEMIKCRNCRFDLSCVYIPRDELSCRSRARNRAMDIMSGNIAVFIDGDIIVKPDYLLILDEFFKHSENIAVSGFRKLINEPIKREDIINKNVFKEDFLKNLANGTDFRHDILGDISYNAAALTAPYLYALSCNLAVPKKFINKVGGYDEDLIKWGIEDIEWVYRLYESGIKILFNTKGEVLHQFHGVVEGRKIKESQINDVNYNAAVFIKKHPHFCGLDDKSIYELFYSIAEKYTLVERRINKNRIVLNFNKKEDYLKLLSKISEYSSLKDTDVIINDSVRTTDIDILLQLMPSTSAAFRYFPQKPKSAAK